MKENEILEEDEFASYLRNIREGKIKITETNKDANTKQR